jgi:excinuclease UvrABC ATPase subunit
MQKKEIHIQGARSNNLQNITVTIPYNQLTVITGVVTVIFCRLLERAPCM